jgi:outer membrane protein OmpA-like peptidoglycan-associated protein
MRFLFIPLLLYSNFVIAQKTEQLEIYIDCYTNNDTISPQEIANLSTINLLNNKAVQQEYALNSLKLTVFDPNGNTTSYKLKYESSFTINDNIKKTIVGSATTKPYAITIENVVLLKKENEQLIPLKSSARFYVNLPSLKTCNELSKSTPTITATVKYTGKVLYGANKIPLINQLIVLKNNNNAIVSSSKTDKYGDFSFSDINATETYKIEIPENEITKNEDVVYIAMQDGTIINNFKKDNGAFNYELLPAELQSLSKMKEDDTILKIKKFESSVSNELIISQNIYYPQNASSIDAKSLPKLDKIISEMKSNMNLKLVITSHTDSKGSETYNKELSVKRAETIAAYFISKGISKNRIKATGMGESQILNRCLDNVDCSEKEHELNRRTEFKFTK